MCKTKPNQPRTCRQKPLELNVDNRSLRFVVQFPASFRRLPIDLGQLGVIPGQKHYTRVRRNLTGELRVFCHIEAKLKTQG